MSNSAKWRKYSREQLEEIVKNSKSDRDVAEALGYSKNGGGTMQSLHRMYEEMNLDTSHFLGQGWNKNNYAYETFTSGTYKKNGSTTLKALTHLRGHKCECCGLSEWLGQPITLEVHHVDGDRLNNSLDNLQILCPNCHSQTENWRGRKRINKIIPEEDFVEMLRKSTSIHQALGNLGLSYGTGNYDRANELMVKYNIKLKEQ